MTMKEFFKQEFKTLWLKTGIRQFETMMGLPDFQNQFDAIIALMSDECFKPPFDMVDDKIKQQALSESILSDKDFIGLNPKFVRRSLNAWWALNKNLYFDRVISNSGLQEAHAPVSWEERNKWLDEWKKELDQTQENLTTIHHMSRQQIEQEGQERPKRATYPSTPKSMVDNSLIHDEWIRANFDPYTGNPKEGFLEETEWRKQNGY